MSEAARCKDNSCAGMRVPEKYVPHKHARGKRY